MADGNWWTRHLSAALLPKPGRQGFDENDLCIRCFDRKREGCGVVSHARH
jgi:hypothetical protein